MVFKCFESPEENCNKNTDGKFYCEVADGAACCRGIYHFCFSFLLFSTYIAAYNNEDDQ